MRDISKLISICPKQPKAMLNPFVLVRIGGRDEAVWLELSHNCPPSPSDVFQIKPASKDQTLSNFESLPPIEVGERLSFLAVADRIVDGEIIFYKCGTGCLWGMIPRDTNYEPAAS